MPDIGRRQLHWAPDADVEVLVRGWDNPLRHTQVAEQWHAPPGMGEEDALVWTNRYGAGRVFATGIGHGPGGALVLLVPGPVHPLGRVGRQASSLFPEPPRPYRDYTDTFR